MCGSHVGCAAEVLGVTGNTAVIPPAPLLLRGKPSAYTPADSAGALGAQPC